MQEKIKKIIKNPARCHSEPDSKKNFLIYLQKFIAAKIVIIFEPDNIKTSLLTLINAKKIWLAITANQKQKYFLNSNQHY